MPDVRIRLQYAKGAALTFTKINKHVRSLSALPPRQCTPEAFLRAGGGSEFLVSFESGQSQKVHLLGLPTR